MTPAESTPVPGYGDDSELDPVDGEAVLLWLETGEVDPWAVPPGRRRVTCFGA
jgi:hypothetical protein